MPMKSQPQLMRGGSSSPSLIRIRRRHYETYTAGNNSSDTHDLGASNGRTRFKRLRKSDHPNPFAFNNQRPKIPLVNKASQFVIVPDAVSGKICQAVRRSKHLVDKRYTFKEASSCCPVGGFSLASAGNRESTDSGSGGEVSESNTVGSNNISSGCPSLSVDLGDAEVPSRREAVRGNDFSNTLFAEDSTSSKDNATTAHDVVLLPGTFINISYPLDNGEKGNQPSLPSKPSSNFDVFSGIGMMGSGSTNPCPTKILEYVDQFRSRNLILVLDDLLLLPRLQLSRQPCLITTFCFKPRQNISTNSLNSRLN